MMMDDYKTRERTTTRETNPMSALRRTRENDDETRRTCCLIDDALKVEMRANAEALWAIVDCIIVSLFISLCVVSFCRKRVRVK